MEIVDYSTYMSMRCGCRYICHLKRGCWYVCPLTSVRMSFEALALTKTTLWLTKLFCKSIGISSLAILEWKPFSSY